MLFPDTSQDLHKLGEWDELIHDDHARFEWIDSDSESSGMESDSAEEDSDDEEAEDGDDDDEMEAK